MLLVGAPVPQREIRLMIPVVPMMTVVRQYQVPVQLEFGISTFCQNEFLSSSWKRDTKVERKSH